MSFFGDDEDEDFVPGMRRKILKPSKKTNLEIPVKRPLSEISEPSAGSESTAASDKLSHASVSDSTQHTVSFLTKKQREALREKREMDEAKQVS